MFVKICGITTEEDALLAVAMGADAVGFMMVNGSTRQVTPQQARDIARRLPPEVMTVAVFRDELKEKVVETVNTMGLGAAQLHGHETPEYSKWVRQRVRTVIAAFPAGSDALEDADSYGADIVLVDGPTPGSGEVFDWRLAEGAPTGRRLLLAGGLTPDNVAQAIETVQPWGVDVSTGVESSPGRKDPRKVRAFVQNAKEAAPTPYEGDEDLRPFDWMLDD